MPWNAKAGSVVGSKTPANAVTIAGRFARIAVGGIVDGAAGEVRTANSFQSSNAVQPTSAVAPIGRSSRSNVPCNVAVPPSTASSGSDR